MHRHLIEVASTSTLPLDVANSLHRAVFHGIGFREGKRSSWYIDPAEPAPPRMHIVRSGRFVPRIFEAMLSLIVSAGTLKRIPPINGLHPWAVVFDRLVDIELRLGDMSPFRKGMLAQGARIDEYFLSLPNDPSLHATIGEYYELIIPFSAQVAENYSDNRELTIRCGKSDYPVTSLVSPTMLEDYPLLQIKRIYCMTDEVFAAIEPDLDKRFFWHSTHDF